MAGYGFASNRPTDLQANLTDVLQTRPGYALIKGGHGAGSDSVDYLVIEQG